jgi:hypothetical protein
MQENNFDVYTYSKIANIDKPQHWSCGLHMFIEKDGITIKLNEKEIQQLVNTLPRTFSGTY